MDRHGHAICVPQPGGGAIERQPMLDFSSGYVRRAAADPAGAGAEAAVAGPPELSQGPRRAALPLGDRRGDGVPHAPVDSGKRGAALDVYVKERSRDDAIWTTFRAETRAWLEANCPAEMREPMRDESDACWGGRNPVFKNEAQKRWMEVMAARGWTVPDWPKDYGGGGLSPAETKILKQEMARIGARNPLMSFGISMLGPALLKYGNEEQKKRFLTEIASGEIRWCQGYSEPGAGSDLASLQTKCEDKGDHWLVNGQKVWTSYADKADWIFCLVRTDPAGAQASGDQLPPVRHGEPGRLDQADPAHLRLFALLRDLLRRREGAQGPARRRRSTRAGTSPNICSATSAR